MAMTRLLAGALAALLLTALTVRPASAATVSDCTQFGVTALQGGEYKYQQNEWNSSAPQCASIDTTSGGWSITQANFNLPTNGAPATYPSSYKGCHWGNCTATGSGMPIRVSDIGTAVSSWSTTQVPSGAYDVAYDVWFNSTATTPGQPDGTELMIWLNSRGGVQPFGSQTGTANLAGHGWNVWTGQQTSWKIISYVLQGGTTAVSNLDVKALINDAVARGSLNPAHFLIDSEVGFEVWQGGQGLASNSYSFAVTPGQNTEPPPNPGGACRATYHVDNDWGTGFTGTVTVSNTGSAATKGWHATWSWPGNQKITNAWNAAVTQNGSGVTADNASFNAQIAGGSSTTFGFQAAYSGANATPTLTCSST
jgi:hypothetical protein